MLSKMFRNLYSLLLLPMVFENWIKVFWYLGITIQKGSQRKGLLSLRSGQKLKIRLSHRYDMECYGRNAYLPSFLQVPDGPVILDIGASIGDFTVKCTSSFKNATVLSFKPDPDAFAMLQENVRINGLKNRIHPFQLGVTATEGECMIKDISYDSVTVEEIFRKNRLDRCDLLKMDIEGCEYEVFRSLSEKVLQRINAITMECHVFDGGKDLTDLIRRLKQSGFTIKTTQINMYKTCYLYAKQCVTSSPEK